MKEQRICKTERKCIERQARVNGPSPISSTLTCSYCTRETNDHVGLKSHKRRKLPNMTIAADWGAKPQIKQISPENFPHAKTESQKQKYVISENIMITMSVNIYSHWLLLQDDIAKKKKNISILKEIFQTLKL